MKRIIYSLYIDIPKEELDWQPPYHGEKKSKTLKTKEQMSEYKDWLLLRHKQYADSIGVDYILFGNDNQWSSYKKSFEKYPFITTYNIVNFYKIHLMYELANEYDEILYLDFDVVPITHLNFFDEWNLSNGIAIFNNNKSAKSDIKELTKLYLNYKKIHSIRSPSAKFWNCKAMLMENDYDSDNNVFNTGIVGISSKHLKQLNYWDNFDSILKMMSDLKNTDGMWPIFIQQMFGWDNETIWSYKVKTTGTQIQWLSDDWHYFMDKWNYIPKNSKLVHVINKNFDYVKEWYETNNI